MRQLIGKQLFVTLIFLSSLGLFVQDVNAQDPRNPDRGFKAANSYSISDIENVNLTNGNLMLNIPLASLPPGRGSSPGYSVGLTYNSKLWNEKREYRSDGIGNGIEGLHYAREMIEMSDNGGWHLDSGYYRLNLVYRLEAEAPCSLSVGYEGYRKNGFVYKMEVQLPNGSVVEFKPNSSTAGDWYGDGYFDTDPWGRRYTYSWQEDHPPDGSDPRAICGQNVSSPSSSGMYYYSQEGSHLRLYIPPQSTSLPWQSLRWTMYSPDGKTVENLPPDDSTIVQRTTDRNGNKLVLKGATVNGFGGSEIVDDAGHYVFVGYDTSTGNSKVIQPGTNGDLLETTIHWTEPYVYHNYRTTYDENANTAYVNTDLFSQVTGVASITMPEQAGGLQYGFTYHASDAQPSAGNYTDGWGQLKSIALPSGAKAEYSYVLYGNATDQESSVLESDQVSSRLLTYDTVYDGQTQHISETTSYGSGPSGGGTCSPDGRCHSEISAAGGFLNHYTYRSQQTGGFVTEKIWVNRRPYSIGYVMIDPFVKTEFTTIPDSSGNPSLTATKDYDYDQNGNVLEVREYDWVPYSSVPRSSTGAVDEYLGVPRPTGLPSGLTLKRKTVNTYYNPTPNTLDSGTNSSNWSGNVSAPKLLNLIKSSEVRDASNGVVSRTEFYYDGGATSPQYGNVTETRVWDSTKGAVSNPLTTSNSILSTATYNQYGMPLTATDANGNVTEITYGAITGPNGTVYDLYPTQTVAAYGTSIAQTMQSEYDFNTGLATKVTKLGNTPSENVVGEAQYDALGRPIKAISASGTALESWTTTEYNDAARRVIVRSDIETKGDGRKIAVQHFDQLGRVRLARTLENPLTEDPTNEQQGIKVQARYKIASGYSYQLASNPYRANYSSNETDPTMGWMRAKSWNHGRRQEVETFSGASLPAPWGSNNASTGIVVTESDTNTATVTDQAGKQRRSITNALGQLVRVDEPTANGLGSISSPNQPTYYSYNTLGKMTRVQQGAQNRYFMYDSLGRTIRVRQPEQEVRAALNTSGNPDNNSWTGGFTYDNNSNVLTTTDAKGATITSTYDALNRPLTRTYDDGTPAVTNFYDGLGLPSVPAFSKGKLTKVTSSVSESRYTSFDNLGRLLSSEQRTPVTDTETIATATPRASSYQYNLSGALTQETYPSGRVVKNELDANGDLAKITSQKSGSSIYVPYASNFSYAASGAVNSMRLGNGRWETTKFNSRLQPTELGLGASATDAGNWKVNYEYGELQTNETVDALKNNGNIGKQTLTIPGTNFVQAYKYDPLNRLTEAKETTSTTQNWIQNFGYDIYGNRTSFSQTIGTTTTTTTPSIDANTNRFNANQGFAFDANGNVTQDVDSVNNHVRQFVFNGDNKQSQVKDVTNNNHIVGTYFYDGEGKRVKKVTDTETTIFVYSLGRIVAEYSTQISSTPSVNYTTTDHLGSPRIITDQFGQVKSRRDFMPFGEELFVNVGARSTALNYGSSADNVRQKFTGYLKDSETSLDFAEARMYENRYGRFTATDPILIKKDRLVDPQRLNRYVYVRNNPLKYKDVNGEDIVLATKNENDGKIVREALAVIAKTDAGRKFLQGLEDSKVTFELSINTTMGTYGRGLVPPGKRGEANGPVIIQINPDLIKTDNEVNKQREKENKKTEENNKAIRQINKDTGSNIPEKPTKLLKVDVPQNNATALTNELVQATNVIGGDKRDQTALEQTVSIPTARTIVNDPVTAKGDPKKFVEEILKPKQP